jgi:LmbE family N-acetylglucosaminyl deacetylase
MKLTAKKILAIGAHPDDIEYGCFGYLQKSRSESEIHLYIASLGSAGDPSSGQSRKKESCEALSLLSPKSLYFRDKVGIEHSDFQEILQELTQLIQTVQPDLILSHGPHDSHQEHKRLYDITMASARRSKASVLAYGIVSNTLDFKPHFFIDIEEVYEKKRAALRFHKSQSEKTYMSEEHLKIFHSNTYASLHGVKYSEAYEIIRIFG